MKRYAKTLAADDSGATVIEYAFIIAATAVALIAAMPAFKSALLGIFNDLVSGWR